MGSLQQLLSGKGHTLAPSDKRPPRGRSIQVSTVHASSLSLLPDAWNVSDSVQLTAAMDAFMPGAHNKSTDAKLAQSIGELKSGALLYVPTHVTLIPVYAS